MARVTYGESITEYAGSIGGVTFLRNASGPIAKLRSRPPVNPSPDQSTYQGNMATLVAYWPTISQPNKILWNEFAALHKHTTPWGVEKTLSGYQWFLICNLFRYARYGSFLPAPPAWTAYSPPDPFTLVATATDLCCKWSPAYEPVDSLHLYLSLPLRQSSLKLRRSLFEIAYYTPGAPITSWDITHYFAFLANITWATFYASANCSIICRISHGYAPTGLFSSFTSAIVKIG